MGIAIAVVNYIIGSIAYCKNIVERICLEPLKIENNLRCISLPYPVQCLCASHVSEVFQSNSGFPTAVFVEN